MSLHFISGLPRSGSTLLAALLRQNPRFHAEMSSPVAMIFASMQRAVSAANEAAYFIGDEQRAQLLRGIFESYYATPRKQVIANIRELLSPAYENDAPDPEEIVDSIHGFGRVVFDTGRQWCAKLPLIATLFPDAKIICCVRDPAWILDSIQGLVRANPLQLSGLFGYEPSGNIYQRCDALMASGGMVGSALGNFKEAFYSDLAGRMFVLDYEALAKKPREALGELYEFINEPLFDHDFENVSYDAAEFDARLGTPGLHSVAGPVQWRERIPVLPPSLFKRYTDTFWRDPAENIGDAMVVT